MNILRRIYRMLTNADYNESIDACVCECGCTFENHRRDKDGRCRCADHGCSKLVERAAS